MDKLVQYQVELKRGLNMDLWNRNIPKEGEERKKIEWLER